MQDNSVTAIGKATKVVSNNKHEDYIQNMFPGKQHDMLLLQLKVDGDNCTFQDIYRQRVTTDYKKYAYRKGSARGGDITFTTKAGSIKKKFVVFVKQLNNVIEVAENENFQEDIRVFRAIRKCIEQNETEIISALENKLDSLEKKEQQKCGFSIEVEDNGKQKFVTDFPTPQYLLIQNGTEGKSVKYGVRSEAKDKTCSICLKNKPLVHGFASPYKFSTVDKPGMVSGFFKQKNNWKNYPICEDCAFDFENGRDYITNNLRQGFYGRPYFIIPQTILSSDDKTLKQILKRVKHFKNQADKDSRATISTGEKSLMKFIAKEFQDNNRFTMNLLFYEENMTTKAMKIKLSLEELLPSRFSELFIKIPEELKSHSFYKDVFYNKESKTKSDLVFQFGLLKEFFDDNFHEIVQTVFMGTEMSKEFLFARLMEKVRDNYAKDISNRVTIVKAHMVMNYLQKLNILKFLNKNPDMIDNLNSEDPEEGNGVKNYAPPFNKEKFDAYVKENQTFLNKPVLTGIFAVGVLVRFLFNLQKHNLDGNAPFAKKLYGYNLDKNRIMKVYLECSSKIQEYSKNEAVYAKLREEINRNFTLNINEMGKLSNNEISFYFVAGLETGNDFKNTNKTNNDNSENN